MRFMLAVYFVAFVLCAITRAEEYNADYRSFLNNPFVKQKTKETGDAIAKDGLPRLAKFIDQDVDFLVKRAVTKMREVSPDNELVAEELEWEYLRVQGAAERQLCYSRSMGDHDPALPFLIKVYHKSVQLIGQDATDALGICDLATIAWGLPVVFHPATFSPNLVHPDEPRQTDYRDHFAKDSGNDHLWGLASVATKYAVMIPCDIATSGIAAFLCGPAGLAAEFIMGTRVYPKLSDRIFNRANGVEDDSN